MRDPNLVLKLLRTDPATACALFGFVVRGQMLNQAMGGPCSLSCSIVNGVYQIDVNPGSGDWFIPFAQGAARYCDVPQGQRDGTLVVTFPMNGCALEVHGYRNVNRMYHDSDGNAMPDVDTKVHRPKFRAESRVYEGAGARAETIFSRFLRPFRKQIGQNFEHTLVSVKSGSRWHVYQTAVVTTMHMDTGSRSSWQIKDGPPVTLGSFAD